MNWTNHVTDLISWCRSNISNWDSKFLPYKLPKLYIANDYNCGYLLLQEIILSKYILKINMHSSDYHIVEIWDKGSNYINEKILAKGVGVEPLEALVNAVKALGPENL